MSRTRVRNQRRTTCPVIGFCDGPAHGTSARLCPRLHSRTSNPSSRSTAWSVPAATVFTETASGARADRPTLEQLLTSCAPATPSSCGNWTGSAGRCGILSTRSLGLAERGIGFRSLQEAIDTTTPAASSSSTLAALAEFERDLIRERTAAGLAAARARGRHGGRPSVMTGHKLQVAREMYASGSTIAAIANTLGVSRASVYRHLTRPDRRVG